MKCDNCKLCLNRIFVDNSLYFFCELCHNVYKLVDKRKVLVEEKETKEKVLKNYQIKRNFILK